MHLLWPLLLAVFLAACDDAADAPRQQPTSASAPRLQVSTQALRELVVYPELSAQAQVTSRNISKISAEISARIESLPVETGQRIPPGKIVARLDCRDAQIALQQAQAQLATAEARLKLAVQQLQRNEGLAARNFISGDALDQRRTEVEVIRAEVRLTRAQVDAARRNASKCVIVSPFAAVVEAKLASAGELASPGTPLLTLWDISGLEVSAAVQHKDVDSLTTAKAIVLETPEARYPLRLKRISPAMDTTARTREARLGFSGDIAPPGASGRLRWQSPLPHVPAEYVVQRSGQYGVFVAEGDKARFVPLADAQEGRPARIDLPLDSRMIVEGRFAVQDQQPIALIERPHVAQP